MAFNVSEFVSYVDKTGTLPTNRFYVNVPPPKVLQGAVIDNKGVRVGVMNMGRDIQFRADAVHLPGLNIMTEQVNRYGIGPIRKFAHNVQFTDVTMSFIADKKSMVWAFFYSWLNNVFNFAETNLGNPYATYRSNYPDDYTVDAIQIYVYDYAGNLVETRELYEAFPVSVSDVSLGWDHNNEIFKITITWAFTDWAMVDVNASGLNLSQSAPASTLIIPAAGASITSGFTLGASTPNDPNALRSTIDNAFINGLVGTAGF